MIITGKITAIERSVKNGWTSVILRKTRKGKQLSIVLFFSDKFLSSFDDNALFVGKTIDVTCFVYSKKRGDWWNTYIVVEKWRPYLRGQKRYKEIIGKNNDLVKLKNLF